MSLNSVRRARLESLSLNIKMNDIKRKKKFELHDINVKWKLFIT